MNPIIHEELRLIYAARTPVIYEAAKMQELEEMAYAERVCPGDLVVFPQFTRHLTGVSGFLVLEYSLCSLDEFPSYTDEYGAPLRIIPYSLATESMENLNQIKQRGIGIETRLVPGSRISWINFGDWTLKYVREDADAEIPIDLDRENTTWCETSRIELDEDYMKELNNW